MVNPDAPKIALDVDFESNHAFFFALFVLLCALGWAMRDHKRRKNEIFLAQQEDRLFSIILAILSSICLFGSYYALRRQVSGKLFDPHQQLIMQKRIEEAVSEKLRDAELETLDLESDPLRIMFILAGGACIASVILLLFWFFVKNRNATVQADFVPRGATKAK